MYTITYYPIAGTTTNSYHGGVQSTAYPKIWKARKYTIHENNRLEFVTDDYRVIILNGCWTIESQ